MIYSDTVKKYSKLYREDVLAVDNTCHLKGINKFSYIFKMIDNGEIGIEDNEKLEKEVIKRANYALLVCNKRMKNWLKSSIDRKELVRIFEAYLRMNQAVVSIDNDTVDQVLEKHDFTKDGVYENIIGNGIPKALNFGMNNILYYVGIITDSNKTTLKLVPLADETNDMAAYDYVCEIMEMDSKKNPIVEKEYFYCECNNKNCAYYKASLAKEKIDGKKEVSCSMSDCEKCSAFKNSSIVSPMRALKIINVIGYSFKNNYTATRVINEGSKVEYGMLPVKQSDKDVIVYADRVNDNEIVIRTINRDEDYMPGTHASPREHTRREHMRYNPKTGLRDIHVRGTIVNKGHDKTNYSVRVHKDRKESTKKEMVKANVIELLQSIENC